MDKSILQLIQKSKTHTEFEQIDVFFGFLIILFFINLNSLTSSTSILSSFYFSPIGRKSVFVRKQPSKWQIQSKKATDRT